MPYVAYVFPGQGAQSKTMVEQSLVTKGILCLT